METDCLQGKRRELREPDGLTGAEYIMNMSSKRVSNILLLPFLVLFLFFLSECILFNSYKNNSYCSINHLVVSKLFWIPSIPMWR